MVVDLFDATFSGSLARTPICCIDGAGVVILEFIQSTALNCLNPTVTDNLLDVDPLARVGMCHSVHETLHRTLER